MARNQLPPGGKWPASPLPEMIAAAVAVLIAGPEDLGRLSAQFSAILVAYDRIGAGNRGDDGGPWSVGRRHRPRRFGADGRLRRAALAGRPDGPGTRPARGAGPDR